MSLRASRVKTIFWWLTFDLSKKDCDAYSRPRLLPLYARGVCRPHLVAKETWLSTELIHWLGSDPSWHVLTCLGFWWWWLAWCSLLRQTKASINVCHTRTGVCDPPLWFNFNWGVRIHQTTQEYRFTAIKDTFSMIWSATLYTLFFSSTQDRDVLWAELDEFAFRRDLTHVITYTVYY